ncbi:hypothetical protein HK104_007704 [Borealophlyctis nickersoniae]|nr:hypothetical protein HK104_007704 [Borealophlyctis nickersoniae]
MTVLCGDLVNTNHEFDPVIEARDAPQNKPHLSRLLRQVEDTAEALAEMRKQQEETEFKAILEGNHDPEGAFPDLVREKGSDTKFEAEVDAESLPRLVGSEKSLRENDDRDLPLWLRMANATGSINFHRRLVRVAPNLMMAGYGGSVPQTLRSDPKTEMHTGNSSL